MVFKLRHPLNGHVYSALPDARVEVDKGGKTGIFDRHGVWISGEIRTADPEMCRWVGTHEKAVVSRHASGFGRSHASTPTPPAEKV